MILGLGTLRPCCPPDQGLFSAVFSDDCDYCTEATRAENIRLMQLPVNEDNTSGIPNCDSSAGIFSSLFSNSCNLANPIGTVVGLPSVPQWVWFAGLGLAGVVVLRGAGRR